MWSSGQSPMEKHSPRLVKCSQALLLSLVAFQQQIQRFCCSLCEQEANAAWKSQKWRWGSAEITTQKLSKCFTVELLWDVKLSHVRHRRELKPFLEWTLSLCVSSESTRYLLLQTNLERKEWGVLSSLKKRTSKPAFQEHISGFSLTERVMKDGFFFFHIAYWLGLSSILLNMLSALDLIRTSELSLSSVQGFKSTH